MLTQIVSPQIAMVVFPPMTARQLQAPKLWRPQLQSEPSELRAPSATAGSRPPPLHVVKGECEIEGPYLCVLQKVGPLHFIQLAPQLEAGSHPRAGTLPSAAPPPAPGPQQPSSSSQEPA